jgi:hypothetical protein
MAAMHGRHQGAKPAGAVTEIEGEDLVVDTALDLCALDVAAQSSVGERGHRSSQGRRL